MSLPTQQWRYVGKVGFNPSAVAGVLEAIYTLGTSSTYADGTSRTPGTGSAATYSKDPSSGTIQAVYATPATTTSLEQRWIFAGVDSGSQTPTMAGADSFTTTYAMVGINKNSGSYNAWDNAAPFTSGQFHGYYNFWNTTHGRGAVHMFECQEAVYIVVGRSNGSTQHALVGAWLDPGSENSADAESDGRLYGVYTSGGSNTPSNMTGSCTASNAWLTHSTGGNSHHVTVFEPNSSSIMALDRNGQLPVNTAQTGRKRSGQHAYSIEKVSCIMNAAPNSYIGNVRDVAFFGYGITGQRLSAASGVVGHLVGEEVDADNEAIILFRNA